MNLKNDGLTVGELTITIGVLFLVFIAWSTISKKKSPNQTELTPSQRTIFLNNKPQRIFHVSSLPMNSTSIQP
ncbi:Hypothetical protein P9211_04191 [Prochlorococcus marinus str. MIT 9211]|uniref:Uncharacterized protein n=1 Tax=Prochlorococcus marinus (strain MIT 9211) TaxID=93059 RepID=A9BE40_PROM4|nr:Hypothetical protein P9211_04191 [Prochlorococcus marinus str. MIT 9211]